ncbi:hypothetical protein C4571_01320 [Candidatus Parcubacteria bacterium]|nr:MAG: hypothetical protein C4571_01320 [Candidatus Parcubacteria bacterium]
MRWISRIVVAVLLNALGLWVAAAYIPGFVLATGDVRGIATIAFILTVFNFVLKPILKLVLGPVIVLTLGFGLILVNAIVLYVLDTVVKDLRIETIPALIYGTLLFTAINFVFHQATARKN